jgi:hypothetical protein
MARFTAVNAREMAANVHAARGQRIASENPVVETSPQMPQTGPHEAPGAYVDAKLSRVRAQLDLVDKGITEQAKPKTIDGQVINWLCAGQQRLDEQARILAGRPLPGRRRPGREREGPHRPALDNWEPQPAPVEPLPG